MVRRRKFRRADLLALLHERQGGKCAICGWPINEGRPFDADHVIPLAAGGPDTLDNIQIVHPSCHRRKTATHDMPAISKVKRLSGGGRKRKGPPMPGSRASRWKKKINGRVEKRDDAH